MFHRINNPHDFAGKKVSEVAVDDVKEQEPSQQSFQYQSKMIEQSALERFARNEAVQVTVSGPANQSAPLTQDQFYVYESQTQQEEKDTPMTSVDTDNKTENNQSATSRIDIPGGVFSRPAAQTAAPMAGRAPGAYPGAYPGAASYGAQSASTANDPAAGRKLYIGQGITLSGEIESCDHLVVEGTVEAALKGASVLEIAEAGAYFGTVDIDEATIAGRFEGDLTVRGRLTIKATGSITGSIAYKELAIEAGANVDGKISPLDPKNVSANRKAPAGKTVGKSADFGAELPFEGKAVAAE